MFDLAIIGAGAAGIACAKYAVKNRLKTILIENSRETFGGTCMNRGCIPAKFFLNHAKLHNWNSLFIQKNEIIESIKGPTLSYLEKSGVRIGWGAATFLDTHRLQLAKENIEARFIVIATGSQPKKLAIHKKAKFAEELFSEPQIGQKFAIIGAGYIGLELASLLKILQKDITVVEKEERILPSFEEQLSSRLRLIFEKKEIPIQTGIDSGTYNFDAFDSILVCAGRAPYLEGLGVEKLGIVQDASGFIKTNEYLQTNVGHIYACGDVIGKKLLAYVAQYQAKICIDNIMGNKIEENYRGIPECVFSFPQVARVGMQEKDLKSSNIKYRIIKSNFLKFSSAYVYDDRDGFMQLIVDEHDRIISAGIISNHAAELISIISFAVRNSLSLAALRDNVFIHPTLSEIIPQFFQEA